MKGYSFHSLFSILISLVRIAVQACRKANPNYEEVKEKQIKWTINDFTKKFGLSIIRLYLYDDRILRMGECTNKNYHDRDFDLIKRS